MLLDSRMWGCCCCPVKGTQTAAAAAATAEATRGGTCHTSSIVCMLPHVTGSRERGVHWVLVGCLFVGVVVSVFCWLYVTVLWSVVVVCGGCVCVHVYDQCVCCSFVVVVCASVCLYCGGFLACTGRSKMVWRAHDTHACGMLRCAMLCYAMPCHAVLHRASLVCHCFDCTGRRNGIRLLLKGRGRLLGRRNRA